MLKLVNTFLLCFVSVGLCACNGATKESYAEKIERFEIDHAIDLVLVAERSVQQSNNEVVADVEYPNFMNYQVPTFFMRLHQSYGIDTSMVRYSDFEWMKEIRRLDQEAKEYSANAPATELDHHH